MKNAEVKKKPTKNQRGKWWNICEDRYKEKQFISNKKKRNKMQK